MSLPVLPEYLRAPLAFLIGGGGTLLLIPLATRLARRVGAVDWPGGRKRHTAPVPRLGGVAVVGGLALGCLVVAATAGVSLDVLVTPHLQALLVGGFLVFATGLLDDVHGVSPRTKLVAQTIAAAAVIASDGLSSQVMLVPGIPAIDLGVLAPLLGVLWIVGVTNAFNLIDGVDGLAGVCAMIAVATLALSGVLMDEPSSFVVVSALLGASAAFLRHNWYPARIFLGDAGSMTIGFLLAVRALTGATDGEQRMHVLVPLAAMAYPLLDTFVAIARRWLRGHPFSQADGQHIHHQLVTIGFSARRAVSTIASVSTVVAVAGLAISFAPPQLTLLLVVASASAGLMLVVFGAWRLGYSEFIALGRSLYSGLSRAKHVVRERIRLADLARQITRASSIEELRETLQAIVDDHHVIRVELGETGAFAVEPMTLAVRARVSPSIAARGGTPTPSAGANVLRLEYPVAGTDGAEHSQLRVWATSLGVAHHTPQCLESIIRPELARWFTAHTTRFDRPAERPLPTHSDAVVA